MRCLGASEIHRSRCTHRTRKKYARKTTTRASVILFPVRSSFFLFTIGISCTVPACCYCCCFSHSAHWLPTRKKLLYTVANPARGLLNRGKKKVWQRPSPPPHPPRCSFGENKNKINTRRIHMSRRYTSRRYARGLGPSRVRTRIPMTHRLGQWVSLCRILRLLPCAIITFLVLLPPSSPGDVWPRLPLLPSTRP